MILPAEGPRSTERAGDRSAKLRRFFAEYVAERAGCADPQIVRAFATVPREPFAGPSPWYIAGPLTFYPSFRGNYVQTPDDDPAYLYQDVLVALDRHRGINIGEPGLHAFCLSRLAVCRGERIVHIGAGSGYYSAVLAELTGAEGRVDAYEIDPVLAERAQSNLATWLHATLHGRSGSAADIPEADVIYVNAGCAYPSESWLLALAPGGRLLFPFQPTRGMGGMLLVTRPRDLTSPRWPAKFISRSVFVACEGLQDDEADHRLITSFASGDWNCVQTIRFDDIDGKTCWLAGNGWWLSTSL